MTDADEHKALKLAALVSPSHWDFDPKGQQSMGRPPPQPKTRKAGPAYRCLWCRTKRTTEASLEDHNLRCTEQRKAA